MEAFLEIAELTTAVSLTGERITIGRDRSNDVSLPSDRRAGRRHAVMERKRAGWSLRDLGVSGGTRVNGQRIWGDVILKDGDEIALGDTIMTYRSSRPVSGMTLTGFALPVPELDTAEESVLEELCAAILAGDVFTEPATPEQIRQKLSITNARLNQLLEGLYEKFAIFDEGDRRRVMLAREAIQRGAVSLVSSAQPDPPKRATRSRAKSPASRATPKPRAAGVPKPRKKR